MPIAAPAGSLQAKCAELGVEMVAGPHCYAFFEGVERFAAHDDEITAFYLTDFLVRQFDAFVWRPMGLDRHPELRDMIFGNYTTLIYQAQTRDPALEAKARDCAARLGLDYEYRFTGYGDLETVLEREATCPKPDTATARNREAESRAIACPRAGDLPTGVFQRALSGPHRKSPDRR